MNYKNVSKVLLSFVLMAVLSCVCWHVEAQALNRNPYTGKETDIKLALLLARTCVAEIGFDGNINECVLMWGINQKNAIKKRRTLRRQTILFNSYWKCRLPRHGSFRECRRIRASKPWIKHLFGENKPKYWPSTMSWDMFRDKWMNIYKKALEFTNLVYGAEMFFDCPLAIDYGAPGEIPAMRRMEKIRCLGGNTRQRYWRVKRKKAK